MSVPHPPHRSPSRRLLGIAAATLALGALGTGCSSSSSPSSTASSSSSSAAAHAASGGTASGAGGAVRTVELTAQDYRFSPSTLKVTPGEHLRLHVTNAGKAEHNLTIPSLKVNADLSPGSSKTIDVTVGSAAAPFYCEYHRSSGMTGTVVIGS